MENSAKQIFFHVGLGKTATTYLQYKVFPYFKNITFIHRKPKYIKVAQIIDSAQNGVFLVSREFDQQLEREVKKFASHHPHTTAIIVFRHHDGWIASQYRRFVKNGYAIPFHQFFDVKEDQGMFKKIDLDFMHKIQVLEKYFTQKPIVLFYDDLRKDAFAFFDYIAQCIGASYNKDDISLEKHHSSYNEKQLKAIFSVSKWLDIRKRNHHNKIIYHVRRVFINIIRYSTLFVAKYLPDSWFNPQPIIHPDELKAVREYYASDWNAVIDYAQKNNPKH